MSRGNMLTERGRIDRVRHDVDDEYARMTYLEIDVLQRLERLEDAVAAAVASPGSLALAEVVVALRRIEERQSRHYDRRDEELAEFFDTLRNASRTVSDGADRVLDDLT